MPFDAPGCFRLDRIPVRPIHWLWRPYLACGKKDGHALWQWFDPTLPHGAG